MGTGGEEKSSDRLGAERRITVPFAYNSSVMTCRWGVLAMRTNAQLFRQPAQALLALVLSLLVVLGAAAATSAAAQRYRLHDQNGEAWLAVVIETEPADAIPWQLRLTASDMDQHLNHSAPLALADGVDQTWSLSNTSAMMVPSEQAELPAGSAQFSLDTLVPAPSENRPLLLRIPLEPEGDAVIISDPALTAALHRAGKHHPAPFR